MGWLFANLGMEQGREYGKDLYDNRLVRTIDRLYLLWIVLTLGVPFLIGYAVGGTLAAGFGGLVWGGLIRIFLYQHATFSVNSICHMFGRQDFRSRDEAATTGSSPCSSSARAGTTTTTRSRARPGTGSCAASSTSPGGSSAASSASASSGT